LLSTHGGSLIPFQNRFQAIFVFGGAQTDRLDFSNYEIIYDLKN